MSSSQQLEYAHASKALSTCMALQCRVRGALVFAVCIIDRGMFSGVGSSCRRTRIQSLVDMQHRM